MAMQLATRPLTRTTNNSKRTIEYTEIDITPKKQKRSDQEDPLTAIPHSDNIAAKREAATRRLQTVWERIIEKYSEPEIVAHGDVVDLETGAILQDNGHLRSIDSSVRSLWTVSNVQKKKVNVAPSESEPLEVAGHNLFTPLLEIDDSQDEGKTTIQIDDDCSDEQELDEDEDEDEDEDQDQDETEENSKYDDNHEDNDLSESDVDLSTFGLDDSDVGSLETNNDLGVPDIRIQMSQKIRQLQKLQKAKSQVNIDYDRLLFPPLEYEKAYANNAVEPNPEKLQEERFFSLFAKPNQVRSSGFFHNADISAKQLRRMTSRALH